VDEELQELARRTDDFATRGEWGPDAEEANRRLIELDPTRVIAYTRLAKCLREMGNPEVAEALYGRVVELDPGSRIARNYLSELKARREGTSKTDVDRLAAERARSRTGVPRTVSDTEFSLLVDACRAVPSTSGEYEQNDYITNVLLTVLDLQMHNVTVNNSITHYWTHRWEEIRTIEQLDAVLARFSSDREGNRDAAQYLWGNNYWNRIGWLRGFVGFLIESRLTDYDSLKAWAQPATTASRTSPGGQMEPPSSSRTPRSGWSAAPRRSWRGWDSPGRMTPSWGKHHERGQRCCPVLYSRVAAWLLGRRPLLVIEAHDPFVWSIDHRTGDPLPALLARGFDRLVAKEWSFPYLEDHLLPIDESSDDFALIDDGADELFGYPLNSGPLPTNRLGAGTHLLRRRGRAAESAHRRPPNRSTHG
jgi:hypothetical protein